MPYESLFEPLQIGPNLRLGNRLVMAPMTTTSGELDGSFSDQEIAYLEQRAANEIGLIMPFGVNSASSVHLALQLANKRARIYTIGLAVSCVASET